MSNANGYGMRDVRVKNVPNSPTGKYQVMAESGPHRWISDEPADVGGADAGPSPSELLGSALGACMVMTAKMYADRKGWPLQEVEALVSRQIISKKSHFTVSVRIEGILNPEEKARLLEIMGRCPVHRALEGSNEIHTRLA